MADPIFLPLLLLTGAGLVGRSDVTGGGPTPPSDGKWGFPVPSWRGYLPSRSQEYRVEDHHGVDIMYPRTPGGADQMWVAGMSGTGEARKSFGTPQWFMPESVPACAARDGTLWQVGRGGHGIYVVIDHGAPFATFYTHLSSTPFPMLEQGANAIKVTKGQVIGTIGFSPLDAQRLMHLHFEVWYRGGANSHVDPWPLLARAPLPAGAAIS